MPYNELQRRESWPPTILRIRDDDEYDTDAIDENPFSFFLTSPEDIDDIEDGEDLSAGIESSSKAQQIREISPSAIQHSPPLPLIDEDEDEDFGLAMPVSLKDFTRKYTNTNDGRQSRATRRPEDSLQGLGILIPTPEFSRNRGRATVRLTPSRSGRGRGQTRSLSVRRPRSWRMPSPDLESIKEERESDDGEEGKIGNGTKEFSASAPATSHIENASPAPKPKKRVHWAF